MDGAELLSRWRRAEGSGLRRALFNRALGLSVPYSGSIRPEVLALRPGHARIAMKDRWRVRGETIQLLRALSGGELDPPPESGQAIARATRLLAAYIRHKAFSKVFSAVMITTEVSSWSCLT